MMGRAIARVPTAVWVVLIWAIAVLPSLTVRSLVWDEGINAELARDVLARGNLLEPAIYGVRWGEKPSLLPWLIAAAARLTGGVNEWSIRLPAMLAVLLTALLVHRLTRRYASAPAALFAAVAFLFCPLLLRKLTVGEPETVITALSFSAFVVWWHGEEGGRTAGWRWLVCGILLTMLAMAKGPQPVAFFALGIGGYLVARRRWTALPGLLLCLALPAAATVAWAMAVYRPGDLPVWLSYMRLGTRFDLWQYVRDRVTFAGGLPLDLLPGTILLPFLLVPRWRRQTVTTPVPVITPLILYAGLCTLVLLVWPQAKTRYAMTAAPAVAVLAGLAIDPLWRRGHMAARAAGALATVLLVYQVGLVTVGMPLFAERFGGTRRAAAALESAIAAAPAPVYTLGGLYSSVLFYVPRPIQLVLDLHAGAISAPAWLLAPSAQVERFEKLHPEFVVQVVVRTSAGHALVAARVERRPPAENPLGERTGRKP
jgi:4-amino-4-deoxy-L-arabinose transferase-like glycosyltransferase